MQEEGQRHNVTPEQTQLSVAEKRKVAAKTRKAIEKKNEQLDTLTIEYIGTGDLSPNKYNPNRQTDYEFELLCRSMEEDGFTQPVIVQQDNIIVDGEHRWRGAMTLGVDPVPCVRVQMSEEQMRISTIRHNRARGTHDVELESNVLRDLQAMGATAWMKDSLMLDDAELNRMLDDVSAPDMHADEEFGNAWEPEQETEESHTTERETGEVVQTGSTRDGIEAQRQREAELKAAQTEEEKEKVRADHKIYRLSLVFSGDEAEVVKTVLGDKPAHKVLELCKNSAQEA